MERLKHLVVDAGALIRLEQLHTLADEFWTVREVVAEVRDKRARQALKTLPFELKTREPTDEALAAVMAFAKQTGDLSVLSKPDIKILALTYMLHVEVHGKEGLRTAPHKPGVNADTGLVASPAQAEAMARADAGDEDGNEDGDGDGDVSAADGKPSDGEARPTVVTEAPAPISKPAHQRDGVSWAAALSGKEPESDGPPAEAGAAPLAAPPAAAGLPAEAASMWDDDDFAGVKEEQPVAAPEPATEAWPSLNATAAQVAKREKYLQEEETVQRQVEAISLEERRKQERRDKKAAREAKAAAAEAKAAAAREAEEDTSELEGKPEAQKKQLFKSRILGASGVTVDSSELEGEGWIDADNIDQVDLFAGIQQGTNPEDSEAARLRSRAAEHEVACVTTDYAMQNVMLQMQMRLMSLEGRSVTHVRRFVLKCDSCASLCRDLERKFCPSCGNPTLARLWFSVSPEGVLRYHYRKGRRVNTRGMRYSLPKPTGGRQGELLLCEDQLLTGWWGQQARKKSTATSIFGEHVTESLGMNLRSQGTGIRVGYGRQNPNAAKGRERRGKKKKRNTKKPGHL